MNVFRSTGHRALKGVVLPTFGLVISAAGVHAWSAGTGSIPLAQLAPSARYLRTSSCKQANGRAGFLKPNAHLIEASGSAVREDRQESRYHWQLAMASAAREGDVVLKSVKVGPLKQEQVQLPNGVSMEALCQAPSTSSEKRRLLPPLVFIHGSYHAAWCWAEHWMPFLASKGYETYSISLRGTSGTKYPDIENDAKGEKVRISEHVEDVRGFVKTFLPGRSPVFVSHSFGGMVLLKLMEELASESDAAAPAAGAETGRSIGAGFRDMMAGCVFACSVPPSGNGPMTKRFVKERPFLAVKIVLGFVLKMAIYWPWLARDLFFTKALEQKSLKRYMANFRANSVNGLDLMDLRNQLPSKLADSDGKALWVRHAPPRLVMGAERDRIVDEAGIEEMANFLETNHVMLPTVPHEVMLGPDWPLGVDRLLQWLEATDFQQSATS